MTGERRRIDHGYDMGGGVRFAAPDSNSIRHAELSVICVGIGVPVSAVIATADMAIMPISDNETLRLCVALSIAEFARLVIMRDRNRATVEVGHA